MLCCMCAVAWPLAQEQHSEDNSNEDHDSTDEETQETSETTSETDENHINSQEVVSETDSNDQTLSPESPNQLLDPKLPLNMNSFLNNPSIAVHPQHASQVNLGTVQNLEAVFDSVYNSNNEGQAVRRSGRNRAEHDYRAMHHGK